MWGRCVKCVQRSGELDESSRCGRVSRHTRRLPHSEAFPNRSSMWSRIPGYWCTFPFLCFLCLFISLTILLSNSEPQIEDCKKSEDLQIYTTCPSHKLVTHHASSRFLSNILFSTRRTGFWFLFYFPFYGYHFLLNMVSIKNQDLNMFPLSRLVSIRLNGLIVQMSRVEGHLLVVLRACLGSKQCHVNRALRGWTTPRAIPVH
jgi:hypothetical protein